MQLVKHFVGRISSTAAVQCRLQALKQSLIEASTSYQRQRHSSASYQSSLKNARALVTQHFSFAHELGFPLPNFTWHTYSHETQLENMVIFVFVFDSWLVLIVILDKEAHSQIS